MSRLQSEGVRPRRFLCIFLFCLATTATVLVSVGIWPRRASAADGGFNTKNPVFSVGCPTCTLGASGEFVRQALKLEGKDIRLCETGVGPKGSLYVAEHRLCPPLSALPGDQGLGVAPPPTDPVDFGATSVMTNLEGVYYGTGDYSAGGPYQSTGPHPHMRAIALIEAPIYIVAAVHAESGIQSWEELKGRKGLRIGGSTIDPILKTVLDYYGLTADVIKANGDTTVRQEQPENADLLISNNAAFNASVENRFWPLVTMKYELRFLPLADPLRAKLEKDFPHYLRQAVMPRSYFQGVDKPVPTVVRRGHLIHARDDMPEQYAYDVARALDRHQDLLGFMYIEMQYNKKTVADTGVIPLHPGAARYYREVGYLK
jgi:TRAP transporter TAXI family solute receptor